MGSAVLTYIRRIETEYSDMGNIHDRATRFWSKIVANEALKANPVSFIDLLGVIDDGQAEATITALEDRYGKHVDVESVREDFKTLSFIDICQTLTLAWNMSPLDERSGLSPATA